MMLHKNKKVKVRSSDGDTDYFGIVTGAEQRVYIRPKAVYYLPRLRA